MPKKGSAPTAAELLLTFADGPQKRKRVGSNRIARNPMSKPKFDTSEWEPRNPEKIPYATYAKILGSNAKAYENTFEKMRQYLRKLKSEKKRSNYTLQTGAKTEDQKFIDRTKKFFSVNVNTAKHGLGARFVQILKEKGQDEGSGVTVSTYVNVVLELLCILKEEGFWHMRLNPGNKTMGEHRYLPFAQRIIELAQTAALEADVDLLLGMFLVKVDPKANAATTIQKVARGQSGRKRSKKEKAARSIQKVVRGNSARKKSGKKSGGKKE